VAKKLKNYLATKTQRHKETQKNRIFSYLKIMQENKKPYIYDDYTINSSNFFVRYAHRNRIKKTLKYILPRVKSGKILDYGCGSGLIISKLNEIEPNCATGYEPFMEVPDNKEILPFYSNYSDILKFAPFHTITILEVFEHLQWNEIDNILNRFSELLSSDGIIIVSVPIEMGPALLLKELNRFRLIKKWRYNFGEFIGALVFGIAGKRDNPDLSFMGHKGFDFKELIRYLKSKNWQVKVLGYTPLPFKCWYGNSQIFFSMEKFSPPRHKNTKEH